MNEPTVIYSDVEEHSTHWPDGAEIGDEERQALSDEFRTVNLTVITTLIEPHERGWVVVWEDDNVFDVRVWTSEADAMRDHQANVECVAELARQS